MRMLREDASAVAKVVEEAYRGASELDDELLDPQLRQVFYDLQDSDVLKVRREEVMEDGRLLRRYNWSVQEEARLAPRVRHAHHDEVGDLYEGLKDVAWQRRGPN